MMTTSNREVPWVSDARSAWLDTVRTWLHAELCARGLMPSGEFECVRERPWAIVLRVPTPEGFVYFKAAGLGGRHEPGLVSELAQRWSDRVPTPLAIDRRCGWMLLRVLAAHCARRLVEPTAWRCGNTCSPYMKRSKSLHASR